MQPLEVEMSFPSRQMDKKLLGALLLCQVLSFLLCITGFTSEVLAERGMAFPTFQSFLNYLLLACTCTAATLCKGGRVVPDRSKWLQYAVIAFLDVEANYMVTKAYQYTSITSVALLDCFAIPCTMLLSVVFLRSKYRHLHYIGAVVCVSGIILLMLTDDASATGGRHPLLGDALVLAAATLYAVCNVSEQALLGHTPLLEFLVMIGLFGSVISGTQVLLLERGVFRTLHWSAAGVAPFIGFALALYAFYIIVPLVLMWSSATMLNISLLTADVWTAAARMMFFGGFGGSAVSFTLSLLLVAVGILVYSSGGSERTAGQQGGEGRVHEEYKPLREEQGDSTA